MDDWEEVKKVKGSSHSQVTAPKTSSKSKDVKEKPKIQQVPGAISTSNTGFFSSLDNLEERIARAQEEKIKKQEEKKLASTKIQVSDKVAIEFDAIEFKIPFEKPGATSKDKQKAAAKPAAKKEEKPREEKISLEACVAKLQVPALRALLEETESRYKEDSDRVLRVADFLLSAFDQCSLPFHKLLRDSPLKAVGLVYKQLIKEQLSVLGTWMHRRDPRQATAALSTILGAASDLLAAPDRPFRLGVAVTLSLIARHRTDAVTALAPELAVQSRRFLGPQRAPLALWLLLEASEADPAAALRAALEGLLPALIGAPSNALMASPDRPIPPIEAELHPAVLETIEAIIKRDAAAKAPRSAVDVPGKAGTTKEPVVSPAALYSLTRAAFGSVEAAGPIPSATKKRLPAFHDSLRDRALDSDPTVLRRPEVLVAALECAAASPGGFEGPQDSLVLHCTRDVVRCILVDSEAVLTKWKSKHADLIRGSARVLQCLATAGPKEVPDAGRVLKGPAFKEALEAMLRKQGKLASAGGALAKAARAAHAAIGTLHPKAVAGRALAPQGQQAGGKAAAPPAGPRKKGPSFEERLMSFITLMGFVVASALTVSYLYYSRLPSEEQMRVAEKVGHLAVQAEESFGWAMDEGVAAIERLRLEGMRLAKEWGLRVPHLSS